MVCGAILVARRKYVRVLSYDRRFILVSQWRMAKLRKAISFLWVSDLCALWRNGLLQVAGDCYRCVRLDCIYIRSYVSPPVLVAQLQVTNMKSNGHWIIGYFFSSVNVKSVMNNNSVLIAYLAPHQWIFGIPVSHSLSACRSLIPSPKSYIGSYSADLP